MRARLLLSAALGCALPLLFAGTSPAQAQAGTGAQTAAALMLPGGGRAAALGGAYTAATDVDALFYNPAAAGWLRAAAAASYQRHAEDIGFITAAGAARIGPLGFALTLAFLDYGSVAEIRPDPDYGGQRGRATGDSWGASEGVARAALALPLLDGRLSLGAAGGVLLVSIAETGRVTPVFDAGAQYRVRDGLMAGAAVRNAGGDLRGAGLGSAPLPTELRAGLTYAVPWQPSAAARLELHADLAAPVHGGSIAPAVGLETRYAPADRRISAALRIGYNGPLGAGATGRLNAGAGIDIRRLSIDYALQHMGPLGAVHRFGVRWAR